MNPGDSISQSKLIKMKPTIWQVLSQWVFLPIITFLLGVVGTYHSQIGEIKQATIVLAKDVTKNNEDIHREAEERKLDDAVLRTGTDDRIRNVANLMESLIKQNTEVIALFRVQQQIVR